MLHCIKFKIIFSDPKWASINFGIVLCIECSGIHRYSIYLSNPVSDLFLKDYTPIRKMTAIHFSNQNYHFTEITKLCEKLNWLAASLSTRNTTKY
jgi:L-rhamnose mutarotase